MTTDRLAEMIEVRVSYPAEHFPHYDTAIHSAVGRLSDFSGIGFGRRDLGWTCRSEIEAARIERGIKRIGLAPEVRTVAPPSPTPQSPAEE